MIKPEYAYELRKSGELADPEHQAAVPLGLLSREALCKAIIDKPAILLLHS